MSKKSVAAHVFARYPKVDTIYITADEQAFFTPEEAEAHAPRLKDKKIATVERDAPEEDADTDIENLGDGTDQYPFERATGEGLVDRDPKNYDAPGATTGAEKVGSRAAEYGKGADLAKAKAEQEAADKAAADKKAAEDAADAEAAAKKAKDEAAKGSQDDGGEDDSPEFSMNNLHAELLNAAKGLGAYKDMTKKQILAVLYPEDEQYQETAE